jgi:hypothetical protein
MSEQNSQRRRRNFKRLALMAFTLAGFMWGLRDLDIRHRLATIEIVTLLLIPMIVLYVRGNWPQKLWLASLVVLLPIWFGTYSLLHEGSHLVGVLLVGEKILDYHLIPHFWQGEFTSAWVGSTILPGWRGVLPGLFPYLRDFLFLIAGWVILKSKRIENCFLVGLVFLLFCLSPLFDIASNYLGYLAEHATGNDFMGTAMKIGGLKTHVIGVLLLSFGLYVVARILWLYTNFPSKVANVARKAQTASS